MLQICDENDCYLLECCVRIVLALIASPTNLDLDRRKEPGEPLEKKEHL